MGFWEKHALAFVVLLVFSAICLLVAAPRTPEDFAPEDFGPSASKSPWELSRQQLGCMLLGWGVIGVMVLLEVLR